MKKNNQIKIAVIGGGYWGKNLVRNFYELGALHILCDSDAAILQENARLYPGLATTASYEDVLNNKEINAVVIATPATTHYQLTKEALFAEKDVLVEKPLALTAAEGEELATLASENKRILMVGHILEYHPAIRKLTELVKSGELGRIKYIYSNRLNLGKFRSEENVLWSFAPHDLAVIIRLLGELPVSVNAYGGNFLNKEIADVTVTGMNFQSGAKAHIFVSWLNPFKEQKLSVVGSEKMAVFDDLATDKLLLYPQKVTWVNAQPVAEKKEAQAVSITAEEPLKEECKHFLHCIAEREEPLTGSRSALDVLTVLTACQQSLERGGSRVNIVSQQNKFFKNVFIHPTSIVEKEVSIGPGSRIWHFSHIMPGAVIGENCNLGQNVFIGEGVQVGNNVKIQNNVSVYEGVTLEDDVFCGPSSVFTNVKTPRSAYPRNTSADYAKTLVKKGTTIGANATIICGITIGEHALVGAGAVVTKDIPPYAVVYGNPAKLKGWICSCGQTIVHQKTVKLTCNSCGTELNL